jgi:hypothetical protein
VTAKKRPPPAFQEYAAPMLASMPFREASLAARGLLWTIRLECWVNGKVPADPRRLARVLGVSDDLTPLLAEVFSFFDVEREHMTCPELEGYREELNDRRARQSAGGKSGAEKANEAKKSKPSANPSGNSSGSSRVLSTEQDSTEQTSQNQSVVGAIIPDDFVSDYENHERTN